MKNITRNVDYVLHASFLKKRNEKKILLDFTRERYFGTRALWKQNESLKAFFGEKRRKNRKIRNPLDAKINSQIGVQGLSTN